MTDPLFAVLNTDWRVESLVFIDLPATSPVPAGCRLVPYAELPPRWYWATSRVPVSVTRRQLKEWLINHDKIDAVEAALNSLSDAKERHKALNWWAEASEFERSHPLVSQFGVALGMTEDDIDAAFTEAAAL